MGVHSGSRWLVLELALIGAALALVGVLLARRPGAAARAELPSAAPSRVLGDDGAPASGAGPAPPSELAPAPVRAERVRVPADPDAVELLLRGRVVARDGGPVVGARVFAEAFDTQPRKRVRSHPVPTELAQLFDEADLERARPEQSASWPLLHDPAGTFGAEPSAADGSFELVVSARTFTESTAIELRLSLEDERWTGGPLLLLAGPERATRVAGAQERGYALPVVVVRDGRAELGDLVLRASDRFVCGGRYARADGTPVPADEVELALRRGALRYATRAQRTRSELRTIACVSGADGRFDAYADTPRSGSVELSATCSFLPFLGPLECSVGRSDLVVRFGAWASAGGRVLLDDAVSGANMHVVAARIGAAQEAQGKSVVGAPLQRDGTFEFAELAAGRYRLTLQHDVDPDARWSCGEFAVGWNEHEPDLVCDLRGLVHMQHVELQDPAGRATSGWACLDTPGAAPFGFAQCLRARSLQGATRVDVFVPGHRCATFELPLRTAVVRLEAGPVLDLGLSSAAVARAAQDGWNYELVPIELEDPRARRFSGQMRLLSVWSGERTRVALPCAGTYELRAVRSGARIRASGARSVRCVVPDGGLSLDP